MPIFVPDPALASRALMASSPSIAVEGVWLRRVGDEMQVLAEVDGSWRLLVSEPVEGSCSHIVEPHGIRSAPFDKVAP